jgi:IclR family acetate operon transcriptional repressor
MKVVNSLIENCFAIVELLAAEARSMRLSEIAGRLDLQSSGVHRVLSTLAGLGWVEQDEATEHYRLSLKLPAIGYRFMQGVSLADVCQPVLDRVAAESKELVRMAVLANNNLTTIGHAQGARGSLICQSRTFPVLPLHVSASGKVWLSTLPREQALKLVLDAGIDRLPMFGPNALVSVDALLEELDRTRARGYGVAFEEAESGVAAVAAVIQPAGGGPVGALAIVVPASRMDPDRIARLAAVVRAGAEELGFIWPLRAVAQDGQQSRDSAAA